jgi:hypothetical protein
MPRSTHKTPSRTKMHTDVNQEAVEKIKQSSSKGDLIAVIGTGISMALTDSKNPALSWKGLFSMGSPME